MVVVSRTALPSWIVSVGRKRPSSVIRENP